MRYSELHSSSIKHIYGAFIIILVENRWSVVTIHLIFNEKQCYSAKLLFFFLSLNSKKYSFKIQ